jgi:hypothetical protein
VQQANYKQQERAHRIDFCDNKHDLKRRITDEISSHDGNDFVYPGDAAIRGEATDEGRHPMADKTPDAAAAFRDVMSQWEQGFNKLANETMGSEAFSQAMHKFTNVPMGMQNQLGELIGRYLAALNLPSRAEMVNIGERIQSMEATLARIEAKLGGASSGAAKVATVEGAPQTDPAMRPPRTKKPPAVEGTP